jgi:hypothetical protein
MNRLADKTMVKIKELTQEQIGAFDPNVGWNPSMRGHFGKIGTIQSAHLQGPAGEVSSYSVEVEGFGSWCWPPDALEEVGNPQFPGHKENELLRKVDEGLVAKSEMLREKLEDTELFRKVKEDFVKKSEERMDKSDDEAIGRHPTKLGGYDKVLYGRCASFVRYSEGLEAGGEFFVFYKAERVHYKLRSADAYGDKANAIIRTLLSEDRSTGGLNGVILVLDNDGYVQLVREQL